MSLADLIAQKKKELAQQQEQEKKLQFVREQGQQKYEEPDFNLFIAAWTPFLNDPRGCDFLSRRDYIKWLLSPSLYVLNTFEKCEEAAFFQAVMNKIKPGNAISLNIAAMLLFDICLFVPKKYQQTFLDVLAGIESEKIPA